MQQDKTHTDPITPGDLATSMGDGELAVRGVYVGPRCTARSKKRMRTFPDDTSKHRCGNVAEHGFRVCRFHGGKSKMKRSGRYSAQMVSLREHYISALKDDSMLDLREPLAVLDAISKRCIERAEERDTPRFRARIFGMLEGAREASVAGNAVTASSLLVQAHMLAKSGAGEDDALREMRESISTFSDRVVAARVEGSGVLIKGVSIVGGTRGIDVKDGAQRLTVEGVRIEGTSEPAIYVGPSCRSVLIEDCFISGGGDNGIQLEGGGVTLRNCGLVGPFGNKAIDCSHGIFRDTRIVHCTVLDPHGYAVGLSGWDGHASNVLANCLILAKPPGPGASGFAIWCPPQGGTYAGNVVLGDAPLESTSRQADGPRVLRCGGWFATGFLSLAPAKEGSPQVGAGVALHSTKTDAIGAVRARGSICAGAVELIR